MHLKTTKIFEYLHYCGQLVRALDLLRLVAVPNSSLDVSRLI